MPIKDPLRNWEPLPVYPAILRERFIGLW